jgi:hypothetical protein
MSDSVATQIGSYLGYVSMVIMGIGSIIALVNHRSIKSRCCDREASISLDIDSTSPPDKKPTINISST